jgi:hypothetical protein
MKREYEEKGKTRLAQELNAKMIKWCIGIAKLHIHPYYQKLIDCFFLFEEISYIN